MQPTRTMRPPGRRLLLGAGLGVAALAGTLATVDASSHREAPLITEDPVADNTDLYAYVSPDAPDAVTLIANFQGFQEPGGGPNYFRFGDDVLYAIKVDNNGDAVPDVIYEFRFTTTTRDPNTFLYATGPITSPTDPDWNRPQTYTVTRVAGGQRTVVASNLPTPPVNAGPRSTPNYEATAAQAVHTIEGNRKVFAGQRAEGFYADIASIFDLGGLRPLNSAHAVPPNDNQPGRNTFAGYNVQSIALQVPKADVLSGSGDPVIGVWSSTSRRKVRVFAQNNGANQQHRGRWVQVSRLGNPLVNEVVVPLALKDAFNGLRPQGDADVPGLPALVTDPELGRRIEQLYPGVDVPPPPRNDLVAIFLTGIPDLNQPQGTVRPAEILRLNTSTPPTPAAQRNRLGLLAGQNDGFPNGRRPGDDVVDIALRAVAGGTPFTPEFNEAPNNALTDGVDGADQPFLGQFPYLGTPYQGYELNNEPRDGD